MMKNYDSCVEKIAELLMKFDMELKGEISIYLNTKDFTVSTVKSDNERIIYIGKTDKDIFDYYDNIQILLSVIGESEEQLRADAELLDIEIEEDDDLSYENVKEVVKRKYMDRLLNDYKEDLEININYKSEEYRQRAAEIIDKALKEVE